MRELHNEKRNLIKKIQESEELKLSIKYLEQKCSNFEIKLDEKESIISRLKQKYAQLEQETNRMEYEYQRLRNNQTTLSFHNHPHHPLSSKSSYQINPTSSTSSSTYGNNNLNTNNQRKSTELPIRHEQRSVYQAPNSVNPTSSSSSSSSASPSQQTSPPNQKPNSQPSVNNNQQSQQQKQRNKSPHLLTIVCNLDPQSQRKKSMDDTQVYLNSNHTSRLSAASFVGQREKEPTLNQPRPKSMVSSKSTETTNYNEFDKYKTYKEYSTFEEYLTSQEQQSGKLSNNNTTSSSTTTTTTSNNTSLNGTNNQPPSMFPKATLLHTTTSIKYQNYRQQSPPKQWTLQQPQQIQQPLYQQNNYSLNGEKHLKYIEKLENDFDMLMKHKQQLDAQLTRLPPKLNNTNMHIYKENIENELNIVEKKLASVKLELRKLNIIKTH